MHRVGAGGLGAFLVAFGFGGLALAPAFMSNTGPVVMGLSTDGLLSTLSPVVGVFLVGAAVRGGRTASTAAVAVGCLFLFSGLGNVLVLDTYAGADAVTGRPPARTDAMIMKSSSPICSPIDSGLFSAPAMSSDAIVG